MFDSEPFKNPATFDETRPQGIYLNFGRLPESGANGPDQATHRCKGAEPNEQGGMAFIALREMLRPLLALEHLRLAAGPLAEQRDLLGRRQRYLVRVDPVP
jgi:hypothetical protein